MEVVNIEIKAAIENPTDIVNRLQHLKARFIGLDHQIDTYFNVPNGRLKLREGNIEHALIYYDRPEIKGLKESNIIYEQLERDSETLKLQLSAALGIKTIVEKNRKIYFIENVKFHIDELIGLGKFVEIEAIGKSGEEEKLQKQCEYYMNQLGIEKIQLLNMSYSDMLIDKT